MAVFKTHKVVVNLPNPLEPDTLYLVRTGVGFDLYCTDTTGSIAYKNNDLTANEILSLLLTVDGTNSGLDADLLDGRQSTDYSLATFNVEDLSARKDLTVEDARYQYLSNLSTQIVNLPLASTAAGKEFSIINTGEIDIEIYDNGITTGILLGLGGLAKCYSTGTDWEIFLDYQSLGVNTNTDTTTIIWDGGNAFTEYYPLTLNLGGAS